MFRVCFIGLLLILSVTALCSSGANAALHSQLVEYKDGATVLEGYLVYDDATAERRPGVVVVHEWKGLDAYSKMRADQLAQLGFVALAADIYGKGIRPQTAEEAGKTAAIYKNDRPLTQRRAAAALAFLRQRKQVDPARLAAIGYCFGGMAVLELARSGADLNGVVSFHGSLDTPDRAKARNLKAKVLVLHGADDPYVSAADLAGFQEEMRQAQADWQFVSYGNAQHGFTNPANKPGAMKGVGYHREAEQRSWQAMRDFFNEIFSTKGAAG